jgi:hypothetical protein
MLLLIALTSISGEKCTLQAACKCQTKSDLEDACAYNVAATMQIKIRATIRDLMSKKELPVYVLGDTRGTQAVILLGEQSTGHVIARLRNSHNVTSNLSGVQARPL